MIRNIVFDMGMVLLDHDPLLPCIRHAGRERAQALCDGIFWHPEWMELRWRRNGRAGLYSARAKPL